MADDGIITALDEQVACYRRLSKLTELQHEHVQQSRTDALLEVLGLRQEMLDQIAGLEKTVAPARRRWSAYIGSLDVASRRRAEALLAESRRLLEAITSADRDDAMILQQQKLNVGRQINQASAARQVNRSYAVAAYGRPSSSMDVQR